MARMNLKYIGDSLENYMPLEFQEKISIESNKNSSKKIPNKMTEKELKDLYSFAILSILKAIKDFLITQNICRDLKKVIENIFKKQTIKFETEKMQKEVDAIYNTKIEVQVVRTESYPGLVSDPDKAALFKKNKVYNPRAIKFSSIKNNLGNSFSRFLRIIAIGIDLNYQNILKIKLININGKHK